MVGKLNREQAIDQYGTELNSIGPIKEKLVVKRANGKTQLDELRERDEVLDDFGNAVAIKRRERLGLLPLVSLGREFGVDDEG